MWNLLSCKRHTELASNQLDRQLCLSEKFQYYIHRFICLMCRRFERQLEIIQRSAKLVCNDTSNLEKLSAEAKKRIRDELNSRA